MILVVEIRRGRAELPDQLLDLMVQNPVCLREEPFERRRRSDDKWLARFGAVDQSVLTFDEDRSQARTGNTPT